MSVRGISHRTRPDLVQGNGGGRLTASPGQHPKTLPTLAYDRFIEFGQSQSHSVVVLVLLLCVTVVVGMWIIRAMPSLLGRAIGAADASREGLHRSVGSFRLRVDRWEVRPGAYVVLVGPSGAGKTLLLETLAGLGRSEKGRIWIGGQEASDLPPEARGIGFVYQDCWLFPHMDVRRNIDFARTYHRHAGGPDGHTASELAGMLGIGDLLDRKPGLSAAGSVSASHSRGR